MVFNYAIALAVFIVGAWLIYRIPDGFLEEYEDWARDHHGTAVEIGFGLVLLVGPVVFAKMLTMPELSGFAYVALALIALTFTVAVVDMNRFWHREYQARCR